MDIRTMAWCAAGSLVLLAGAARGQVGWFANGNNLFYNGGNVGIGTSNPTMRLHVIAPTNPIFGSTTSPGAIAIGVQGQSSSTFGRGVYGFATSATGPSYGGLFRALSNQGSGVLALADSPTGTTSGIRAQAASTNGIGIWGIATAGVGSTAGVRAQSNSNSGTGVIGLVVAPSGFTNGVFGESASVDGAGVFGYAASEFGVNYGVYGETASLQDGFGVFSVGDSGASGNKLFQIDHPLDPANRFLNHFSAEGPEPYLVYRGNAVFDDRGTAVVQLPHYFEAINRDVTYQLTPIGAPMDLYIAREVANNEFVIAGGSPGLKVSWTVTGIRNDPYVQRYGARQEPMKPAALRGKFLHPELYNQPGTRALRARPPAVLAPSVTTADSAPAAGTGSGAQR